jgi:uncharacterized protein (TIGR02246 family)
MRPDRGERDHPLLDPPGKFRSLAFPMEVKMSEVSDAVDAQLDAYFARDLERFVACYAPDVVITNASGQVLAEGHDAVREMYGGLFENSPNLAGRIANRIVVGDFVADHEEIEGFVLPGSPTSIQAIAVYQVAGGKIGRVALYF